MPRKNSLFTRKNSETTTLSLKVPTTLKSRLDAVNKQLQAIDPDLQFNYQDNLRSELEKLVKSAENELKKMVPEKPPVTAGNLMRDSDKEKRTSTSFTQYRDEKELECESA